MEEIKTAWYIIEQGGSYGVLFMVSVILYWKLDKQEKRTDTKDEKIYNLIA